MGPLRHPILGGGRCPYRGEIPRMTVSALASGLYSPGGVDGDLFIARTAAGGYAAASISWPARTLTLLGTHSVPSGYYGAQIHPPTRTGISFGETSDPQGAKYGPYDPLTGVINFTTFLATPASSAYGLVDVANNLWWQGSDYRSGLIAYGSISGSPGAGVLTLTGDMSPINNTYAAPTVCDPVLGLLWIQYSDGTTAKTYVAKYNKATGALLETPRLLLTGVVPAHQGTTDPTSRYIWLKNVATGIISLATYDDDGNLTVIGPRTPYTFNNILAVVPDRRMMIANLTTDYTQVYVGPYC